MVSIKDIARATFTTSSTVSRALNNKPGVSEETKQIILDKAKEMGYVPNENARNLRTSNKKQIGVIVPTLASPICSELVLRLEEYITKLGYTTILCSTSTDVDLPSDVDVEIRHIKTLQSLNVKGIVNVLSNLDDSYDLSFIHTPMSSFDRKISDKIPYVYANGFFGGYLAAKELHATCKSKRLLYLGYGDTNEFVKERAEGFAAYCFENHIMYSYLDKSDDALEVQDFIQQNGKTIEEHDGIFVNGDFLGIAVISYLQSKKLNIPKDISVISFDGLKSLEFFRPRLSTIDQNVSEIAKCLVDLVIRLDEHEKVEPKNIIQVIYRRGETTNEL